MSFKLCPFCMQRTESDTCPHCGKDTNYAGRPLHLPAGYVVSGRHPYVLGAALGQGGFGITYIALDMETNKRVAIKEYFPTYCAGRTAENMVTAYQDQEAVYEKGRNRFLDEARVLQSLSDLPSIVNVLDFFEGNNSAYLVMEFLEGESLKTYAREKGKFPAQPFLQQLRPLMADLEQMHQRRVVHRDIAPDNIILTPDGQMKLIDFGAARSYAGDKSMTVVVKKGFAPIEQYTRRGSGAYTDVYALAATIYYCITGVVPPDSAERQYDEQMLKSPSSLGAELSGAQEHALKKALEVQPKKRTQSVAELMKALEHVPKQEKTKTDQREPEAEKKSNSKAEGQKKTRWMIPAVATVLLCIAAGVLFLSKETPAAPDETVPAQAAVPETQPQETIPEAETLETVPEQPTETVPETTAPTEAPTIAEVIAEVVYPVVDTGYNIAAAKAEFYDCRMYTLDNGITRFEIDYKTSAGNKVVVFAHVGKEETPAYWYEPAAVTTGEKETLVFEMETELLNKSYGPDIHIRNGDDDVLSWILIYHTEEYMKLTDGNPTGNAKKIKTGKEGEVKVHSVTMQPLDNGYVRFSVDCTPPANRNITFFDPPNGNKFMYHSKETTSGERMTLELDVRQKDIQKLSDITIKFWQTGRNTGGTFIYLKGSFKVK